MIQIRLRLLYFLTQLQQDLHWFCPQEGSVDEILNWLTEHFYQETLQDFSSEEIAFYTLLLICWLTLPAPQLRVELSD